MNELHPSPYYILFYGGGFFVSSNDTKKGCTGEKNHAEYQNTKLYRKNHSTKKIHADKKSAVLHLQGNKKNPRKVNIYLEHGHAGRQQYTMSYPEKS